MDFEIYGLRIFCQVIRDGSFSEAARALKLTQPTVSQQIGKLESELGGRLFERIGHRIIPTPLAKELHAFASQTIERVDAFKDELREKRSSPRGLVRYAMPESCQWTPHFRAIMNQLAKMPEIQFEIDIAPSEQILEGLLDARYDFGFVVGEKLAPELRFEKFSEERYSLVAASLDLFAPMKAKQYESLRLVTSPGWELFFSSWAKSHGIWEHLKACLKSPTVQIAILPALSSIDKVRKSV